MKSEIIELNKVIGKVYDLKDEIESKSMAPKNLINDNIVRLNIAILKMKAVSKSIRNL